jgi:hypothetical protein
MNRNGSERREAYTFADQMNEILEKSKFFRYKGQIQNYGMKKLP